MKVLFQIAFALALAAIVAAFSFQAVAQQPPQGQTGDHEAQHREMMQRGTLAMGFDQERTTHQFQLHEDGGAIEVSVNEANDHVNLHAVRQHLQEIAGLFKAGDFGKPALTHAQEVPGTVDMARLKDQIAYQYQETPAGGRVRIVTKDAKALAAVHEFLRFQIADHGTGDSAELQPVARDQNQASTAATPPPNDQPSQRNMADMMRVQQQMVAETKAADAKLDQLLGQMNAATGQTKISAIADVVSEIARQQKTMRERMGAMQGQMMSGGGMMMKKE